MGCKCIQPNINNEDEIESKGKSKKKNDTNNQNQTQVKSMYGNQDSNDTNIYILEKINNNSKTIINNISSLNFQEENEIPNDEFSRYIYENINIVRTNPKSFIPTIKKGISNITHDKHNRLIYKSNVKVALTKGEPAFEEAIKYLNDISPMNKLIYKSKMTIPVPDREEDIIDKNYFQEKVNEIIQNNNVSIRTYWRDIIKDAETSFILMIVDDTGNKSGLKRKDILDPNMKFIGISSVMIGKRFVCFMTLGD